MLKRSSPPVGDKGNIVKHLALGLRERHCEIALTATSRLFRVAQNDTIAVSICFNGQLLLLLLL